MSKQDIINSLNKAAKMADLANEIDLVIFSPASATLDAMGQKESFEHFEDKIKNKFSNLEEFAEQVLINSKQRIDNLENDSGDIFSGIWELQQNYFLFNKLWGSQKNWPHQIEKGFLNLDSRAYEIPKDAEAYSELSVLAERAELPEEQCIPSLRYIVEKPTNGINLKINLMDYSFCPNEKLKGLQSNLVAADSGDHFPVELMKLLKNDSWTVSTIAGDTIRLRNFINDNWELVFELEAEGLHPQYYFWEGTCNSINSFNNTFQFKISLDKNKINHFNIQDELKDKVISIYFGADQILKVKLQF